MHDLDPTLLETDDDPIFETDEEAYREHGGLHDLTGLDENEELELASELLEVASDEELDHFLGGLIRRVSRAIPKSAKRALGGALRRVARRALPYAGGALGAFVGGPVGATIGRSLASRAGSMFGLELEGLSEEDQELETARQFVRFASAAARNLDGTGLDGPGAVKDAVTRAAQSFAPGLLTGGRSAGRSRQSGRWQRRGNTIVLFGVE